MNTLIMTLADLQEHLRKVELNLLPKDLDLKAIRIPTMADLRVANPLLRRVAKAQKWSGKVAVYVGDSDTSSAAITVL